MNLLEELEQKENLEVLNIKQNNIENIEIEFIFKNRILPPNEYIEIKRLGDVHVIFKINNIKIHTNMNRIFIHQLGQRVLQKYYKKEYYDNYIFNTAIEDYQDVLNDWQYSFNEDRANLIKNCERIFYEEKLVIKYYQYDKKFLLYGIVSNSYKNTSQNEFRNILLKVLHDKFPTLIAPIKMSKVNAHYFSPIKEHLSLNINSPFETKIGLVIIYGLNNGYRSYSVHIHRYDQNKFLFAPITLEKMQNTLKEILTKNIANDNDVKKLLDINNLRIERKQILEMAEDESNLGLSWRNNPRFHTDIEKFIERIIIKMLFYFVSFEQKIKIAKQKKYNQSELSKYFQLMRISQSSEQRVINKINELSATNGMTCYNISEGFREIGTFENAIPKETKRFLIEVGSKFIDEENYLENTLKENKEIFMDGNYSFIDM